MPPKRKQQPGDKAKGGGTGRGGAIGYGGTHVGKRGRHRAKHSIEAACLCGRRLVCKVAVHAVHCCAGIIARQTPQPSSLWPTSSPLPHPSPSTHPCSTRDTQQAQAAGLRVRSQRAATHTTYSPSTSGHYTPPTHPARAGTTHHPPTQHERALHTPPTHPARESSSHTTHLPSTSSRFERMDPMREVATTE